MTNITTVVFAFICALTSLDFAYANPKKVALVIGINKYTHAPKLKNPQNDAKAIAKVLREIGFDVLEAPNLKRIAFEDHLTAFAQKASEADISVVYYAGHGIQVQGNVYLIPADTKLLDKRDVRKLIRAENILEDAARASRLAVVILDACRDSPFTRSLAEAFGASRSTVVGKGLTRVANVPRNTLIAYSTQAGNVALDGSGGNSPYATALIQHIRVPKKDVRMVFGAIRDSVLTLTDQRQEPFTYGSLGGDPLYLHSVEGSADSTAVGFVSSTINPTLVTNATITPRTANRAQPIDNEFAAWYVAREQNNWQKIEQLLIEKPDTIYGVISDELLRLHVSDPSMSVQTAISDLARLPVDLATQPRTFVRMVQRKLSSASYYGTSPSGAFDSPTRTALYAFVRDVIGSGNVTFYSLLALAELADTQNVTESLTGRWKGRYYYPRPQNGVESVPFEMDLTMSQGRVTGHVTEPATFGDDTSANLYADFSGLIIGNKIEWRKKYDGTGGISHSVLYSGTLDRKKRRIDGRWIIKESWSGRFYIELD